MFRFRPLRAVRNYSAGSVGISVIELVPFSYMEASTNLYRRKRVVIYGILYAHGSTGLL